MSQSPAKVVQLVWNKTKPEYFEFPAALLSQCSQLYLDITACCKVDGNKGEVIELPLYELFSSLQCDIRGTLQNLLDYLAQGSTFQKDFLRDHLSLHQSKNLMRMALTLDMNGVALYLLINCVHIYIDGYKYLVDFILDPNLIRDFLEMEYAQLLNPLTLIEDIFKLGNPQWDQKVVQNRHIFVEYACKHSHNDLALVYFPHENALIIMQKNKNNPDALTMVPLHVKNIAPHKDVHLFSNSDLGITDLENIVSNVPFFKATLEGKIDGARNSKYSIKRTNTYFIIKYVGFYLCIGLYDNTDIFHVISDTHFDLGRLKEDDYILVNVAPWEEIYFEVDYKFISKKGEQV